MWDLDMLGLWLIVTVVIGGFIGAALYAMSLSYKEGFKDVGASETDVAWVAFDAKGEHGLGKSYPRGNYYGAFGVPDCAIEYVSAYDPINTVKFHDPADAYEYVVKAVAFKNKALDRLENQTYLGEPMFYFHLVLDMHRERDYWLAELHEYREDA